MVEFVTPSLAPLHGEIAARSVQGLGHIEQVLFRLEDTDNLNGVRHMFAG